MFKSLIKAQWLAHVEPRLILWAGATMALSLAVGTLVAAAVLWRDMTAESEQDMRRLLRLLSQHTLRVVEPVDQSLQEIRKTLEHAGFGREALSPQRLHELIRPYAVMKPHVVRFGIVDRDGRILATTDQRHPSNEVRVDAPWLRQLAQKPNTGLVVGTPQPSQISGQMIVPFARAIVAVDGGEFQGAVEAALDVAALQDFHNRVQLQDGWHLALLRQDGIVLSSVDPPPHWRVAAPMLDLAQSSANAEGFELLRWRPEGSDTLLLGLGDIGGWPLVAAVSVDAAVTTSWRKRALAVASITLPAALGVILMTWLASLAARRARALSHTLSITEARHRSLVESSPDGILLAKAGRIVYANPAMLRFAGVEAANELVDKRVDELLDGLGAYRRNTEFDGPAPSSVVRIEHFLRPLRGTPIEVETLIAPGPQDDDGSLLIMVRDVSERKRMQREIDASQRRLEELALASEGAREREKVRIARELHDELGQVLTVQQLDLEMLSNEIKSMPPRARQRLGAMRSRIDDALAVTRRIASDLRPLVLDDLGLVAAFDWLLSQAKTRRGIEGTLEVRGDATTLRSELATALFRIAQECLTNVMRHANARQAILQLDIGPQTIMLRVQDDGCGIDPHAVCHGLGLLGIQERARLLGGEAAIESAPGGGTVVQVRLPATQRADHNPAQAHPA